MPRLLLAGTMLAIVTAACGGATPSSPSNAGVPRPTALASPSAAASASSGPTAGASADGPSPAVPTQTPSPTPWTPIASPAATHPPTGLVRDALVEVVTDGLRVRSLPGTSERSRKFKPLLQRGDTVFIEDGPVAADGYDWYLVQSLIGGITRGPFGWVAAAGRDGEAWIDDRVPTACPDLSRGAPLLLHAPAEVLLHCFGARTITFTLEADPYCEGGPWGEPAWLVTIVCQLASDGNELVISGGPKEGVGIGERARGTPGLAAWDLGYWRMRGHFDDLAAPSCVRFTQPPMEPAKFVHRCRTTLVLERFRRTEQAGPAQTVVLPYCGRPVRPSTLALVGLSAADCYGPKDLTFDATLLAHDIDIDGPVPDTPARFDALSSPTDGRKLFLVDRGMSFDYLRSIRLRVAEPGTAPITSPDRLDVRVTGHVDDPSAHDCRGSAEMTDAEALGLCRSWFVVTSMTPLRR